MLGFLGEPHRDGEGKSIKFIEIVFKNQNFQNLENFQNDENDENLNIFQNDEKFEKVNILGKSIFFSK